jgi:hypothetical protein
MNFRQRKKVAQRLAGRMIFTKEYLLFEYAKQAGVSYKKIRREPVTCQLMAIFAEDLNTKRKIYQAILGQWEVPSQNWDFAKGISPRLNVQSET